MTPDLLVIIVFAIVFGGIVFIGNFRRIQADKVREANFKRANLEKRAKQAIWAGATIVSSHPHTAAEEMRQRVRLDLTLQIQPPQGEPYTARTSWRVDLPLVSQFQPGQALSIKIDPDDPDLIFPNQPGVEYWDK